MKISAYTSLGARDDVSIVPVVSGGVNYKQTVSVLLDGYATQAYADSLVVGLWDDRGNFDASGGSYPSSGGSGTAGAVNKGDIWTISVAGTLPTGQAVEVGDTVRALIDTPGNTQANWAIAQNNIGYVPLNAASNLSDLTNASTARSNLGVAIGTDVQAYHDNLQYFSGLTATGDGLPYFSSGSAMSLATFTAFARTLLDDVDAATMRTTLGATIGTNVQAWDTDLDTIAGLSASDDDIIQRKAGAWANRTMAQLAADLQGSGLTASMVGFREVPSNSQSAAYTTVAADSGKSIDHPSTDANARTYTIDSNANVAYPVGTCITFTNMTSQVVTIAITSDTMYLAGTGSTGSRSLAQYGIATARKLTSTTWLISGTGLT